MFELKITANTVAELLASVSALAALGVTVSVTPPGADVPLPEPRFPAEEPEKPKRKTKAEKIAEEVDRLRDMHARQVVEQVAPTAQTDENLNATRITDGLAEVEAIVEGKAEPARVYEPDAPHAPPGAQYLLKEDRPNNEGHQITYKDGARFSSVMNPEVSGLASYDQHAPEIPDPDADIPEHMRDDTGPRTIEEALQGVEPTQEGEEVPEGILEACEQLPDRPTSPEADTATDGVQPVEPEPATSEPTTSASSDGAETSDSGLSAEAESGLPAEFVAFIDTVESADTWDAVKLAMRDFYQSELFRGMTPKAQNKVRGDTASVCAERSLSGDLKGLPDQIDDLSYFRLWLEDQADPDAIRGTLATLRTSAQWKAASDGNKTAIVAAVDVRLAGLG